jgi:hypothetical protein
LPPAAAGFKQIARTADIQEAFVLACKARGWRVLRGGRATHGHGHVGTILVFELSIGFRNVLSKSIGAGSVKDDRARLRGAPRKLVYARLVD